MTENIGINENTNIVVHLAYIAFLGDDHVKDVPLGYNKCSKHLQCI